MAEAPVVKQSALRTALAGLIGNVLEWFDFAVYGYFASNIGHQFFPKSDPAAQQFLAFAVFALGFFWPRPAGSLILGRVGDRIGRRPLLTLSIGLMGIATLILGLLPTYDQIGVAAPLLLMLMRVAQGILARRRIHRIDGVHDRGRIAADSRTRQQLHGGRHDDRIHSRFCDRLCHQRQHDAGGGGRLGMAHSVRRQRRLPGHRLPAAARHRGNRRGAQGHRRSSSALGLPRRRPVGDPSGVRHRGDDQRRVLPDVHVRRRAAEEPGGGRRRDERRRVSARQHAEPLRRLVLEGARRLVVGQGRPAQADDHSPDQRARHHLLCPEDDDVRRRRDPSSSDR